MKEYYYYTMDAYYYTYISLYDNDCLKKIIKYYENDDNYDIQTLTITPKNIVVDMNMKELEKLDKLPQ